MAESKDAARAGSNGNTVSDREKWEFDRDMRLREADMRAIELRRFRWSNPLVIAVLTAAVAALGNLGVLLYQASIEQEKAEHALVLETVRLGGGGQQSDDNLSFLLQANLLTNPERRKGIMEYLKKRRSAQGPGITVVQPIAQAAPAHYDFPTYNQQSIDPTGWSIDVFSCSPDGPGYKTANDFARFLATEADNRRAVEGNKLGRIRFTSGLQWRHRRTIIVDAEETDVGRALQRALAARAGAGFEVEPNPRNEAASPSYVSVFFCS